MLYFSRLNSAFWSKEGFLSDIKSFTFAQILLHVVQLRMIYFLLKDKSLSLWCFFYTSLFSRVSKLILLCLLLLKLKDKILKNVRDTRINFCGFYREMPNNFKTNWSLVLNIILLKFSTNTINNGGKKKNIKLQFQAWLFGKWCKISASLRAFLINAKLVNFLLVVKSMDNLAKKL